MALGWGTNGVLLAILYGMCGDGKGVWSRGVTICVVMGRGCGQGV